MNVQDGSMLSPEEFDSEGGGIEGGIICSVRRNVIGKIAVLGTYKWKIQMGNMVFSEHRGGNMYNVGVNNGHFKPLVHRGGWEGWGVFLIK